MYEDFTEVKEVIPCVKKIPMYDKAQIKLYGNRIEIIAREKLVLDFDNASTITVLGRNKLNVYHGGKIYQFKGDKRFCALKYVHIYNRYCNVKKGDENYEFLGL